MLNDLHDYISLLFSSRWPTTEAVVTGADVQLLPRTLGHGNRPWIQVTYEFSVNNDGPYTGTSIWSPLWFQVQVNEKATYWSSSRLGPESFYEKFAMNKKVIVRYRRDDPSVNKLDRSAWQDFVDVFVDDL